MHGARGVLLPERHQSVPPRRHRSPRSARNPGAQLMALLPYSRQEINDADIAAVSTALRALHLTQGPLVDRFETELAAAVGARFAVAFNSGTAALHGAY